MSGYFLGPDGTVIHGPIIPEAVEFYRPVVVIDPEDRDQVERLRAALYATRSLATDNLQAALRSLVAPPKPEEPTGLGAVVKDADGERWIRLHTHPDDCNDWYPVRESMYSDQDVTYSARKHYSQIDAVRVLSEGWSE